MVWNGLKLAIWWLNVWSRISVCEADRATQGRRIAKDELKLEEQVIQIESLKALLRIGVVRVNRQGEIIYADQNFATITEYSVETLTHMRISALVPAQYRPDHDTKFSEVMIDKRALRVDPMDVELRTASGRTIPVVVRLSPIPSESGIIVQGDVQRR